MLREIDGWLAQLADWIGQVPAIVWILISSGIAVGILVKFYRAVKFVYQLLNVKPVELLDQMERNIQKKIDLVEKVIAPAEKTRKKRKKSND